MRDLHYLVPDSSGARPEWIGDNGREQWISHNIPAALEMQDSEIGKRDVCMCFCICVQRYEFYLARNSKTQNLSLPDQAKLT